MTLATTFDEIAPNPLDRLEQIVSAHEWPFERNGDDEMVFSIGGTHAQYHMWFGWHGDMGALEVRCAIDVAVPPRRFREVSEVLTRVNAQLWIGHFDSNPEESGVVFRHTLLSGEGGLRAAELETMVEVALSSCERCYPAFMLLLWGGRSPADAVAAAMLDTVGEA